MPGMDGGEVARTLETNPETKDIPIMFLTGMFPKRENEHEGRMIADHLLFAKPYELDKLVAGIEELLQEQVDVV
jgi:CheY-like chemotaxis protein